MIWAEPLQILNRHHFHGKPAPAAVYVGRGTALGNRFVVGEFGSRDECVDAYGIWLDREISARNPAILTALAALRADTSLLCSCAPSRCHAEKIRDAWLRLAARGGIRPVPAFHVDGTAAVNAEVFVVGANLAGRHGAGAALAARRRFGAEPGVGLGYRGAAPAHSWAIPTKDAAILSLPLEAVKTHVQAFDLDTLAHPEQRYFVTRVGCGLAGNRDAEMAPLFRSGAIGRCSFPLEWRRYLRPQGMCYAGIGARNAPSDVLSLMTRIARRLAARGFILRSGAAEVADMAFEAGCDASEIFLPWPGFNDSGSPLDNPSAAALAVAQAVHPAFERLSPAAQKLMARNSHQILGPDLRTPADFVVCWTPDGAETEDQCTPLTGRTGQAIALADRWSVPLFNLTRPGALLRIGEHISGCA